MSDLNSPMSLDTSRSNAAGFPGESPLYHSDRDIASAIAPPSTSSRPKRASSGWASAMKPLRVEAPDLRTNWRVLKAICEDRLGE